MKRILLLSTGGTIASEPGASGLSPAMKGENLLRRIPELMGAYEIHCQELFSLDSSNIQPENWVLLADTIFRALEQFDGFVITHGTDTMAYTAAMLSFMLQNLPKPVILTGSQLPASHPETDAFKNLKDSFLAAADERLKGIFVVFDHSIIQGTCAKKLSSRKFHAFFSINRPEAGHVEQDEIRLNDPSKTCLREDTLFHLNTRLDPAVLLLSLYPGIRPELLTNAASSGYRAVVLEAFGLGGIPGRKQSLLPGIRFLTEKRIPVIITTQCPFDGTDLTVYQVGSDALAAGAQNGGSLTTEAILTKLMWILGQTDNYDTILKFFRTDLAGELEMP